MKTYLVKSVSLGVVSVLLSLSYTKAQNYNYAKSAEMPASSPAQYGGGGSPPAQYGGGESPPAYGGGGSAPAYGGGGSAPAYGGGGNSPAPYGGGDGGYGGGGGGYGGGGGGYGPPDGGPGFPPPPFGYGPMWGNPWFGLGNGLEAVVIIVVGAILFVVVFVVIVDFIKWMGDLFFAGKTQVVNLVANKPKPPKPFKELEDLEERRMGVSWDDVTDVLMSVLAAVDNYQAGVYHKGNVVKM